MRSQLIYLLLLAAAPSFATEVHKCIGQDGKAIYRDTPCPGSTRPAGTRRIKAEKKDTTRYREHETWCDRGMAPAKIVDQCFSIWKPMLRDPRSAYADHGQYAMSEENKDEAIFVRIRAKNGFGGTSIVQARCGIFSTGLFNPEATIAWLHATEAMSPRTREREIPVVQCASKRRKLK